MADAVFDAMLKIFFTPELPVGEMAVMELQRKSVEACAHDIKLLSDVDAGSRWVTCRGKVLHRHRFSRRQMVAIKAIKAKQIRDDAIAAINAFTRYKMRQPSFTRMLFGLPQGV